MEPDILDADQKVRRVRVSQALLVTTGVATAVLPPLVQSEALPAGLLFYAASMLLMPAAYGLFAWAIEGAVRAFVPPMTSRRTVVLLALFVGAPCVGGILEIVLVYHLAKQTSRLEGARDRGGLVVALSLLRGVAVWAGAMLIAPFLLVNGQAGLIAFYAAGPIVSLAILAIITQIIVAPLLDQLVPSTTKVRLAGAGATSSMAVPSSSGAPAPGERP